MKGTRALADTDGDSRVPEVSVLMAVFNGAQTLDTAIQSIVNQTFENWELILVDDASTDDLNSVVNQFRDTRIRVIRNVTNLGLAASLNRGVAAASAPYIARMDADDICYPSRLEHQLRQLKAQPSIDVLGTSILVFQVDGEPLGIALAPIEHAAICISKLNGSFSLFHPTWMGRADWFRRHPYDPAFSKAQDFELLLRAAPTSRYGNLPDVLLAYRVDLVLRLRKRLQTRIHVLKALVKNVRTLRDRLELLPVAAFTALKVGGDVVSSLRGVMVFSKLRFRALSQTELGTWFDIWSTFENNPRNQNPARRV